MDRTALALALTPEAAAVEHGVDQVLGQVATLSGVVTSRFGTDSVPGRVEDRQAVAELLGLARALRGDEQDARAWVAWHLAVLGLWCPRPEAHHAHQGGPVVWAPYVTLLLAQDVAAGHYSIRGLAHRYCHLGADRTLARSVLHELLPFYAWGSEVRCGPHRVTVADHALNKARRRVNRMYGLREDVRDERLTHLLWATGHASAWD